MSNFSYLSTRPEYSLFANSAIEAEKVFSTSPAMCAVGGEMHRLLRLAPAPNDLPYKSLPHQKQDERLQPAAKQKMSGAVSYVFSLPNNTYTQ